jgi:hypothetical protein
MVIRKAVFYVLLAGALGVALAQQGDSPDDTGQAESAGEPTTVIDELSQAEIDAELARAEKVLDDPDEVKEYTDDTPLPADLPLALPSDF